jgi:hypothetical protein
MPMLEPHRRPHEPRPRRLLKAKRPDGLGKQYAVMYNEAEEIEQHWRDQLASEGRLTYFPIIRLPN